MIVFHIDVQAERIRIVETSGEWRVFEKLIQAPVTGVKMPHGYLFIQKNWSSTCEKGFIYNGCVWQGSGVLWMENARKSDVNKISTEIKTVGTGRFQEAAVASSGVAAEA